jgi:hypothetical protein
LALSKSSRATLACPFFAASIKGVKPSRSNHSVADRANNKREHSRCPPSAASDKARPQSARSRAASSAIFILPASPTIAAWQMAWAKRSERVGLSMLSFHLKKGKGRSKESRLARLAVRFVSLYRFFKAREFGLRKRVEARRQTS